MYVCWFVCTAECTYVCMFVCLSECLIACSCGFLIVRFVLVCLHACMRFFMYVGTVRLFACMYVWLYAIMFICE